RPAVHPRYRPRSDGRRIRRSPSRPPRRPAPSGTGPGPRRGGRRCGPGARANSASVRRPRGRRRRRPAAPSRTSGWSVRSPLTSPETTTQGDQVETGAGRPSALVALRGAGARPGLGFILDGQYAVADGQTPQTEVGQGAGRLIRDNLKMIGLAANDAAEGDIAVVADAGGRAADLLGQGDGGRNLERAGHRGDIDLC